MTSKLSFGSATARAGSLAQVGASRVTDRTQPTAALSKLPPHSDNTPCSVPPVPAAQRRPTAPTPDEVRRARDVVPGAEVPRQRSGPVFVPHAKRGPLGTVRRGYGVWAIVPLRFMVWERNPDVFRLDDRSLCIACCASPFAGPAYGVREGDAPEWFQGTAMMLARWAEVADAYAPWIARLPGSEPGYRCGDRHALTPRVGQFLETRWLKWLPVSLHADPVTMTLLVRIVVGLELDPASLTLAGKPLSDWEPFRVAVRQEERDAQLRAQRGVGAFVGRVVAFLRKRLGYA